MRIPEHHHVSGFCQHAIAGEKKGCTDLKQPIFVQSTKQIFEPTQVSQGTLFMCSMLHALTAVPVTQ